MRMQPKIGEIITVENVKYITELAVNLDKPCKECHLRYKPCMDIDCASLVRKDHKTVIFKEVKEIEVKEMEIKIQIPDNCELIKDGDTYIVKEKKQQPPRSWEEFCEKYPRTTNEYYIRDSSFIERIGNTSCPRNSKLDKNNCVSAEEAEAFLALMQLRQLRKTWVGNWKPSGKYYYAIIFSIGTGLKIVDYTFTHKVLSFPTKEMAEDFFNCFNDLCEKAKILL